MATNWLNGDSLYVKFGTNEITPAKGGAVNKVGDPRQCYVFDLDLTTLGDSSGFIFLSDTLTIPTGAIVDEVRVTVTEVTAGTNSNFNLGVYKTDRTTAIDADGYLAAADVWHTAAIGTVTSYVVGTTEAGADIGQVHGADPGLIVAFYDTGAFTAGKLRIEIFWIMTTADML